MLKYYYGVMNSGKSASLLMSAYQREKDGKKVLILKPYDKRDKNRISSRVGLSKECITFSPEDNLIHIVAHLKPSKVDCIYVDECQFLTKCQVKQLWKLSNEVGFEISCFGLKTNFKNELFESVQALMVYADKIKSIQPPSTCKHCLNVATTHLLIVNDKVALDFPEVFEGDVDGDIRFECVCQDCWQKRVNSCN